MGLRLIGQDTRINVVHETTGLLAGFDDVQSFTMTHQREVLDEGYLDQTTNQKDSVYNGVAFEITLHSETRKILTEFVETLNSVTRSRVAGASIQIVTTFNFADGQARYIIPACEFGDIPINAGGRAEYVEFSFSGQASQARILAA